MFHKPKILCLICARGGSKGVPGKNIRPLGGIPLIGWSIHFAKQCSFFDRIVVSTDDEQIAQIAIRYGAEVPFLRPAYLAEDHSPEWNVWQHAIVELRNQGFCPDYMVCLPPTSPFRSYTDVENSVSLLGADNTDIVITVSQSGRNPYFNMIELDRCNYARLCKKTGQKIFRRQDAPDVYDITTVAYAARSQFILDAGGIFDGMVKTNLVPPVRALDIDTELDFQFAQFLTSGNILIENEVHIPTH